MKMNIPIDQSATGVKFDYLLNAKPNYHVTENYFVDIMPSCLEGNANFG